ncbi:Polyadenylation factor subunit 2 [Psilocybe cubensis]|uniref:Polyadenylation factor subunit 2 n=2 Tax=Psilocybe cubensis TaxID=181762 RepID=A0A8H8CNF5_PSICU|nr:Polyadenylation factor subunit 2 [Psilocybe cubensis]KAH9483622.1 Polyadenylation factor subunit 2 [Psilocybe cubensis]
MSTTTLPILLPGYAIPKSISTPHLDWKPRRYLSEPQPPPQDEGKLLEQELANARQMIDGKIIKKTRPRRTVDYNGGMGRWALLRKLRPNPNYVPNLRPAPPFIIDLLPPKAYPENPSTSLCTKFVHTSTNKIRCPVNVVTWTPEARRVLTGSTSGEFTLWNGLTFNFETILQAHDSAICAMTFTHSGAYLASADKTGIIKYFEPNMNNLTAWQGSSSREAIRGLSFSPDDRRFATASDDSSIRIWSFAERRVESVLSGHGWDVKCVEWHPTKGLLVSGSKDNQIKFWDPRTGTVLSTLHQHKNTIQALSWSPNGNMVASASRDQTVRVFDIRAMKEFRVLKGHKKEVCSVTWHPVHPLLVSGGSEGAILHWDLSTPDDNSFTQAVSAPRATLSQAHDSNVWSVAFHPFGHLLASASNDHTTRFWSRERPGDATSVFSGGGEKPPEIVDMQGQEEEEDAMVPGFGAGGGGGNAAWWGKEEDGGAGGGPSDIGPRRGGGYPDHAEEDFIPGFGGGPPADSRPRQNGYSSMAHDSYENSEKDEFGRDRDLNSGGGHGHSDDWGRGGGGGGGYNRGARFGPSRRGRY